MVIASLLDAARDGFAGRKRAAAPWKPVELPSLEERYDELERLVGLLNKEVPRLRDENERLRAENEELRSRLGEGKEGERPT